MNLEILKYKIRDRIAEIFINRPEALNALNSRFFDELNYLLGLIEADEKVKVLTITGIGKAFAAGADIKEMANLKYDEALLFSEKGQSTFNRIDNFKLPVIAAINGFALGGGCELAMACDIRIASEDAKLGQPEVNLGLIPGYGATYRLPKIIGLNNALYLLFTGEMINADAALRMGLVQRIVSSETLIEETQKIAGIISKKGPIAVSKIKGIIKGSNNLKDDILNNEREDFASLFESEGREGMLAFLEKRKPNWN